MGFDLVLDPAPLVGIERKAVHDGAGFAVGGAEHPRSPGQVLVLGAVRLENTYPMDFGEFVLEYQPQASWFYRLSQSELLAPARLDAVVRFDRLKEDLHRLSPIAAAVQVSEVLEPLLRLNETSHPPWQELCTAQLAEVMAYRWAPDLALW